MEWTQNRKWFAIALIGIIAPISLLTAFKLTGILPESKIETLTVDNVSVNITRPSQLAWLGQWIENNYSNEVVSINLRVNTGTYHVDDPQYAPYDYLNLKIVATANTAKGFIQYVIVRLFRVDIKGKINILTNSPLLEAHNLRIERVKDRPLTDESYIMASAIGKPDGCDLTSNFDWVFIDQRELDHMLTIVLETTIFNGTAYQKIVIPIEIGAMAP